MHIFTYYRHMQPLTFTITIQAPKEKVWHTMLNLETYKQWASAFHPDSSYEGNWDAHSTIYFVDQNKSGLQATVLENTLYLKIVLGNFIELKESVLMQETSTMWQDATEAYTFNEVNGTTTLHVTTATPAEFAPYMEDAWPKALQKLQEMCEATTNQITVACELNANIQTVWSAWTEPSAINTWYHASEDWEASNTTNTLATGERFSIFMSAKDKSFGFNFTGIYKTITPLTYLEYYLDDGRRVETTFTKTDNTVVVTQIFDPESVNSLELQKAGWQAILDNFKKYTAYSSLA